MYSSSQKLLGYRRAQRVNLLPDLIACMYPNQLEQLLERIYSKSIPNPLKTERFALQFYD
jgi:hypothetical protein